MSRLSVALAALMLLACGQASNSAPTPTPAAESEGAAGSFAPPADSIPLDSAAAPCPAASAHVYHPARLHLLAGCQVATARGLIQSEKGEADGDFHVLLQVDPDSLDPKGGHWINARNTSQQRGDLVLEPVCERRVTQRDAVAACQGYHNPLVLPALGTHVTVTGYFVFDAQHGWNELHPLLSAVAS